MKGNVYIYYGGAFVATSWAWLRSAAGQKAISEGAEVLYHGYIYIGDAATSAANQAGKAISKGIAWVGDSASNAWESISGSGNHAVSRLIKKLE